MYTKWPALAEVCVLRVLLVCFVYSVKCAKWVIDHAATAATLDRLAVMNRQAAVKVF